MTNGLKPLYRRVLLKMSGEALMGKETYAIDPEVLDRMAKDITQVYQLGVQVAIVIGGGNFFRGPPCKRWASIV